MLGKRGIVALIIIGFLLLSSLAEAYSPNMLPQHTLPIKNSKFSKKISYIMGLERTAYSINHNPVVYYTHDFHGSIVHESSNIAGINEYYTAYGDPVWYKQATTPFQYNSARYDSHSGIIYFGNKEYIPKLKIFISGERDDLLNKYKYVDENPIMKANAMGHNALSFLERMIKGEPIWKVAGFMYAVYFFTSTSFCIVSYTIRYIYKTYRLRQITRQSIAKAEDILADKDNTEARKIAKFSAYDVIDKKKISVPIRDIPLEYEKWRVASRLKLVDAISDDKFIEKIRQKWTDEEAEIVSTPPKKEKIFLRKK
jgi:RHS repeat-associated protein